jgi:hypothetical protein
VNTKFKMPPAAGRSGSATEDVFPRVPVKIEFEAEAPRATGLFRSLGAVNSVLQRINQRPEQRDIFEQVRRKRLSS